MLPNPFKLLLPLFFLNSIITLSAQGIGCKNPGGNPPCPENNVVIDVLISVDEYFVDYYGTQARSKAEEGVIEAFSQLQSKLSADINLELNIVQFPNIVVPKSEVSSLQHIKDFITNAGFAHKFDLYIHLSTTQSPSGVNGEHDGLSLCSTNDGAKSIVFVRGADPEGIAHEVMHFLGRSSHLDESPYVDGPCDQCDAIANDGLLMCTTALGFLLTSCDVGCVRKLIEMGKCDCIKRRHPQFGPDETINHIIRPSIVSYSRPILNCAPGGDILELKVTLENNTTETIQKNIRLYFSSRASAMFSPILDQNFNKINTINGRTELSMESNGQEVHHTILPGAAIEFSFKCNLITNTNSSTPGNINSIHAYTGSSFIEANNNGTLTKIILNIPHAYDGNTTLEYLPSDIFLTSGILTLTEPSSGLFIATDKRIFMGPGTKLKIASNASLTNVDIQGCNEMWAGIELLPQKDFFLNNCEIADARIGVEVKYGSDVIIENSYLKNNDLGLFLNSNEKETHIIGTKFETFSDLKNMYQGQNPVPNQIGFSGIYSKSSNLNSVGNKFSRLQNGIISTNSELNLKSNTFQLIRYSNTYGFGSVTGSILPHSGVGVFAQNGKLNCNDGTLISGVHTGIYLKGATSAIHNSNISGSNFGVKAFLSTTNITDSRIAATEVGISAMATTASIINNKIDASGSATATGIRAGGDDYFLVGRAASISENIINATGTKAVGIHLPFSNGAKLVKNTIILNSGGQSKSAGILLDGGYADLLQCNTITGTGQAGILSNMAAYPTLECNNSSQTSNGIWFEGSSLGKFGARLRGNKMSNHGIGLRLGDVAVIGEQRHRGNIFDGVSAISFNPDASVTSLFKVDPTYNLQFLPNFWDPSDWFVETTSDVASFTCIDGVHCPLPSVLPPLGKQEVVKIIENTGGTSLAGQAQAWNTKVRLFHALQTESNPWQAEQIVTEFLANNANTDLGLYANMRAAIGELIFQPEPNYVQIQNLLNQNQELPVLSPWQSVEKQVNRILLQTIGIHQEPSYEQKEELISIAGLCAQEYGEAVLRAKALLFLFDTPFSESDCISQPAQERMYLQAYNSEEIQIRIAPNPVTDRLAGFVQMPELAMILPRIEIRDVYGALRKIILMKTQLHHLDEDMSAFEPGIYFLSVCGTDKTKAKVKIFTILK